VKDVNNRIKRLSGNQLKLIALVAMTCDHVGKELFPDWIILQIIGRLAFPIFAYMIAEGCLYTKNRRKHLLSIAGLAVVCQITYWIVEGSLFQCILVTFSLSICMIYALDHARKQMTVQSRVLAFVVCAVVYFVTDLLPVILSGTDYAVDYGIWGVLLPVVVYFAPKERKLPLTAALLVVLCVAAGGIQWYSLTSLILLACYNGQRGKARIKHLFFVYYPVHLVVIYLLSTF